MATPDVMYARNDGGAYVAYQTIGAGPFDLVFVPEWVSNLDLAWDSPRMAAAIGRLSSFCRVLWFDKLGTGLSDPLPVAEAATLESWMDDVRTVMAANACRRAVLLSTGFGAMMAALFAATHPERVSSLVLMNGFARPARAPDYPPGMPTAIQERVLREIATNWGRGAFAELFVEPEPAARSWWSRYQRGSASPGVAVALCRSFFQTDVRHVLPILRTPTLVLHRSGDLWARVGHGRHLAENIPGARYVELDGGEWEATTRRSTRSRSS